MPDAPWEKYATNVATIEGPWSKYTAKPTKRTREEVIASIGPSSPSEPTLPLKVAAGAYDVLGAPLQVASRLDPLSAVTDFLEGLWGASQAAGLQAPGTPNPMTQPLLPPDIARQAVEFMTPGGAGAVGSATQGAQQFVGDLASGLTAPPTAAAMLAGRVSPVIPATSFAVPMVQDIPQATEALLGSQGSAEAMQNALRLGLDVAGPLGLGKPVVGEMYKVPQPSGLTWADIPPAKGYDYPRMLPEFAGPEAPTKPRFVTAPSGQVVDLTQLTPKEQVELMRGPRVYQPREERVRPAQAPPVVLEPSKLPIIRSMEILPTEEITPVTVPSKLPVEPSGGEVSFRAPAAAQAIPSARQAALIGATEAGFSGLEQAPQTLINQVVDIVTTKDRLLLKETRDMLSGPEQQAPGVGVKGASVNDVLRIIDLRFQELNSGKAKPELEKLREIIGREPETAPTPQPLVTEVKVSPPEQKLITTEVPSASTIRGDQTKLSQEGLQAEGREAYRSENIQQQTQAGAETSQPSLPQEKLRYHDAHGAEAQILSSGEIQPRSGFSVGEPFTRATKDALLFVSKEPVSPRQQQAEYSSTIDEYSVRPIKLSEDSVDIQFREKTTGKTVSVKDLYEAGERNSEKLIEAGKKRLAQEVAKPEMVKLGSSRFKNPLGDPIGSTYRATPEDWTDWQKVQSDMKALKEQGIGLEAPEMKALWQKNEAIKNKYGGNPPEPPAEAPRLYSIPGMLFDPQFYKDTRKQAAETTKHVREYFKGAEDFVLPALRFDTKSPLPKHQDIATATQIYSQPFALEKVPFFGRLMGGKARIRTPQDASLARWYGEFHGMAPAVGNMVVANLGRELTKVFKPNEVGDIAVRPTKVGQSLKIGDVFEALLRDPSSYNLTPQQRSVFERFSEPVQRAMKELADENKVVITRDAYFPRTVIKHPKMEEGRTGGAARPLSKTAVQRERAFATEQEGWEKGYVYSTDIEARLGAGVENLYKAIANKRLADDPTLAAKSVQQKRAELRESYAEQLQSGDMTEAQLERILEGVRQRGIVMQPMLMNKIFEPETAKILRREFAAEESKLRKAIVSGNNLAKALSLGFDLGVGQIQLLPSLYTNPRIWGEAQLRGLHSMADPRAFTQYTRQHLNSVKELAQLGISVGKLPEFIEGLGKKEVLAKVPGVGQISQMFGRQFQTALDVAKIEFWEAFKENTPTSEWPKLAQAIEALTLSSRMEASMVPHSRALLERVALLAPSYYRGAANNLVASLIEKGQAGKQSRLALGKFVVGSTITYYVLAKQLGMSEDEIKERMNPARTDFMTWRVQREDGSTINVGFGGIHRSVLRLLGNTTRLTVEKDWKTLLSPEKSPASRWYRAHSGPIVSTAWEAFSGKDFLGRESDISTLGTKFLPLMVQQAVTREGEAPATSIEYAASALGMIAFPESFSETRKKTIEAEAQKLYKKPYEKLPQDQRYYVMRSVDERLAGKPTGMTVERSRQLALKKADERTALLHSELPQDLLTFAKRNNLKVGGYQTTKEMAGTTIQFSPEEQEMLHTNMVASFGKYLQHFQDYVKSQPPTSVADKQRTLDRYLEAARKEAWNNVLLEVEKKR